MEVFLVIGGILLILIGFIGSALPVLPGPPLAWLGYLLLRWTDYIKDNDGYNTSLWIMLFLVIVVTLLDYLVPVWGTKKWGGSRRGMWGATIGLIIGLFLGPIGIVIGPFAGAFIGELTSGKQQQEALRSGWGSFVGFLMGVGLKLMVCGTILFLFIYYLVR
ncbi:MAG: DUF456 domain-containing protein [Bacteroidales bacterium]|nr:DUF456 domain-containing protein [Bacteroidales bacterium]